MIRVENCQFFVQKCHFGGEIMIQILSFVYFYYQQKMDWWSFSSFFFLKKKYPSIKSNNEKFFLIANETFQSRHNITKKSLIW